MIHNCETLDQALVMTRVHGGTLYKWPDGYWSPADPAEHPASAVGDMSVRVGRVAPAIANAMAATAQVVTEPGAITLKGRDR